MNTKPTVLITGASTGIGAVYAERFARRGHDLVLVARNTARMTALADRLHSETGVKVEIIPADLTVAQDLARIAQRLTEDSNVGILVNNAGMALPGSFVSQNGDDIASLIALNITAVTSLAHAAAGQFSKNGTGAIINLSSVASFIPEMHATIYGASKAFILFLSQSLNMELTNKGVYVQAVLPAVTRTEIWDHAGVDINTMTGVMEVEDLVDAALAGFDRQEAVTIPPLPEAEQWQAFEAARQAMLPGFSHSQPAQRYRDGV